jgi:hypothetical protein
MSPHHWAGGTGVWNTQKDGPGPASLRVTRSGSRVCSQRESTSPAPPKAATIPNESQFELFKTTSIFDSTTYHPDWLGEEPERVQEVMQGEG